MAGSPAPSPTVVELYVQHELSDPDFEALSSLDLSDIDIDMSSTATATTGPALGGDSASGMNLDLTPASSMATAEMTEPQDDKAEAQEAQQEATRSRSRPQTRSTTGCHGPKSTTSDYVLRFKGNNSKKWDNKDIVFDGQWLEDNYDKMELCPGRVLNIPFNGKGWRVVIVSVPGTCVS